MSWANKYIQELQHGKISKFRPFGNSMTGIIESGNLVTVIIVQKQEIEIGSVVLCKVNGKQYLHLVKDINGDMFQIGNNRGGINGWTEFKNIYGILLKVEK